MRIKNLKEYYLKNKQIVVDEKEGGRYETFSPNAILIKANIYDKDVTAVSTVNGIVRKREKRMLMESEGAICQYDDSNRQEVYRMPDGNTIASGDGICVYVSKDSNPDYRISSIRMAGHFVCTLERINGRYREAAQTD